MFASVSELDQALCESGYIADPVTVSTVFLSTALHRPVLLEGPAGSGKTQLAYAVAEAAHTRVERLQCYQGINEEKAIGRFDESLQRLFVQFQAQLGAIDWAELAVRAARAGFLYRRSTPSRVGIRKALRPAYR